MDSKAETPLLLTIIATAPAARTPSTRRGLEDLANPSGYSWNTKPGYDPSQNHSVYRNLPFPGPGKGEQILSS